MPASPTKDAPDGEASAPLENSPTGNTQQQEQQQLGEEDLTSLPGKSGEEEDTRTNPKEQPEELEEGEELESTPEEKGDAQEGDTTNPPLPDEALPPPLPSEAPPGQDDGWEPVWDNHAGAYYFYNRFTRVSQWDNPRVPDPSEEQGDEDDDNNNDSSNAGNSKSDDVPPVAGGYNPAIHGDYDPTAPYAQVYERRPEDEAAGMANPGGPGYDAVGSFNRFTGRWQAGTANQNPEYHNDENKSRRQMNAFFDVDAAANSHDGRSLRAERSAKKLSKKELKMFKEKRREKKEEKRRAWLRD